MTGTADPHEAISELRRALRNSRLAVDHYYRRVRELEESARYLLTTMENDGAVLNGAIERLRRALGDVE